MTSILNNKDHRLQVLVTGFDSFKMRGVAVGKNASGEAVKLLHLKKETIEDLCDIDLFTEVVPVEYKYIDKCVPLLFEELQPHLSIHVGVSDLAKGLTLENLATKAQYTIGDNNGECPDAAVNPCVGPDRITTDLPIDRICEEFNHGLPEGCLKADISSDAGKYVCEYIYYTSLALHEQMDKRKSSLFVHVPLMTKHEEFIEIMEKLERLIIICIQHIRSTTYDHDGNSI